MNSVRRFAIIEKGVVENIIVWDERTPYQFPEGKKVAPLDSENEHLKIGDKINSVDVEIFKSEEIKPIEVVEETPPLPEKKPKRPWWKVLLFIK